MDEPKATSHYANFLAKLESVVAITLQDVSDVNVLCVRDYSLSHLSCVVGPYEVLGHLPHYCYFKLPFVDERICLVAFASCVEVVPVPS